MLRLSSPRIIRWAKSYNLSIREEAKCARQTSDGGILIAGRAGSRPHSGGTDIFIIKTDSTGNLSDGCEFVNEVYLYYDDIDVLAWRTYISGKNLEVTASIPEKFTAIKTTFEHSEIWCGNYKKAKRPR